MILNVFALVKGGWKYQGYIRYRDIRLPSYRIATRPRALTMYGRVVWP